MREEERLAALHDLGVLDTAPEPAFDELTRLAAQAVGLPAAAITLVDADRQWMKSRVGDLPAETARRDAFCHHTIRSAEVMVVEDATRDPRFAHNPLVTAEGGIRFYAGAPLTLSDGATVGAICVIGPRPRQGLSQAEAMLLKSLAAAVSNLLELRREVAQRRRAETAMAERARLLDLAEQMARVGHWKLDLDTHGVFWSPVVYEIHGLDPAAFNPALQSALELYIPGDRGRLQALVERARQFGEGYHCEARLRRASDGALREIATRAQVEFEAGAPRRLVGVFRDVTEEKRALAVLTAARHKAEADAARMERLATTDALTGLLNRRAFIEQVENALAEAAGARRGALPVLAVLDIDHFKAINDGFGHDAGDEVLRAFAHRCEEALQGSGVVGRIGGEEFAVLVRGLGLLNSQAVLERVRLAVIGEPIAAGAGRTLPVTFSAGLAQARPDEGWRGVFNRADQALYAAKRAGRDRLMAA